MSALTPFIFADDKGSPPNSRAKSRVPWFFAVACCIYYLSTYWWFASATPHFAKLFEGLGIEIPFPSRLLVTKFRWLYPVLFVGASALTIFKQFVPLEGLPLRISNFALILIGVVFPPLVVLLWYWPMFELIWKLKSVS